MQRLRRNPRRSLIALGSVAVLLPVVAGEPLQGYSKLGLPYLLHAGLFALLLVPVAAGGEHLPLSRAARGVVVAVGTLVALYPVAVGLMWYDLVHTPPASYYTPPSLAEIARDRLQLVLLLAPLAGGYAVGTARGTTGPSRWGLVVPTVLLLGCGPLITAWLAIAGGSHPGFTSVAYGFAWVGSAVPAGLFFTMARYDSGNEG